MCVCVFVRDGVVMGNLQYITIPYPHHPAPFCRAYGGIAEKNICIPIYYYYDNNNICARDRVEGYIGGGGSE